jgi:hypothetical protein
MESETIPTVADDAPALAGAIVQHAGAVCETADHLWRVIGRISIPTDGLIDARQQAKAANGTEPMARLYLYQTICDLAHDALDEDDRPHNECKGEDEEGWIVNDDVCTDGGTILGFFDASKPQPYDNSRRVWYESEVADRLKERPSLLKELGLESVPSQQSISYAWRQFSEQTEQILDATAMGIALEAIDNGVIMRARVPIVPDEDDTEEDGDEQTSTREHVREKGTKLVELARRPRLRSHLLDDIEHLFETEAMLAEDRLCEVVEVGFAGLAPVLLSVLTGRSSVDNRVTLAVDHVTVSPNSTSGKLLCSCSPSNQAWLVGRQSFCGI